MANETLEFYSNADKSENITGTINTVKNLRFKESFIVAGAILNAGDIYANYDLKVLGGLCAENVTVLGNLYVSGDISANKLVCSNSVICEGCIDANEIVVDDFVFSENIACKSLQAREIMVKESVDVVGTIDITGNIYAADGIIGEGDLNADNIITINYLDFSGNQNGNVFDLSVEKPTGSTSNQDIPQDELSIGERIRNIIEELHTLEEDQFVQRIKELGKEIPNLQITDFLIDRIIELTYKKKIDNLADYLMAYWAIQEFPIEVQEYETIKLVLKDMMKAVETKFIELPFSPTDQEDVAYCLFVINKYRKQLSDAYETLADIIYSRIGLRYKTVTQLLSRN